jgi:hypothetical protein
MGSRPWGLPSWLAGWLVGGAVVVAGETYRRTWSLPRLGTPPATPLPNNNNRAPLCMPASHTSPRKKGVMADTDKVSELG